MSGTLISTARGKVPQRALRFIDQLPYCSTFNLGVVDYGAAGAGVDYEFQTPASRRGKVVAVNLFQCTESFNAVTTSASVQIGTGADPDGYAFTDDIGSLLANNAVAFTSYDGNLNDGALGSTLPEGSEIQIRTVGPTGGTPTGIAYTSLDVFFFE